jgi:hypothetical protein
LETLAILYSLLTRKGRADHRADFEDAYGSFRIAEKSPTNVFQNAVLRAKVVISPSGQSLVTIQPMNATSEQLLRLAVCYAAALGWDLGDEPNNMDSIYETILGEVVTNWPETPTRFLDSIPNVSIVRNDPEFKNKWAVEGGEEFEVNLIESTNQPPFVMEYVPGMPGRGPAGLAINLCWHYFLLLEEILIQLEADDIALLGDALTKVFLLLQRDDCDKTTVEGKTTLMNTANQYVDVLIAAH